MSSLSVGSLYFVDDNYPGGSDDINLRRVNQRMKNDFGNLLSPVLLHVAHLPIEVESAAH